MNNMQEILFRGKSLSNSEWIEGQPHTYGDGIFICQTRLMSNDGKDWRVPGIEVDPESVEQYINRNCDKTGEKIFNDMEVEFSEPGSIYDWPKIKRTGIVKFGDCSFYIEGKNGVKHYRWMDYEVEIIET
jgi:hypothetical protein